jgi:hypothetical protein
MKFPHFSWRPILACLDPDPLTQLNPDLDPKHYIEAVKKVKRQNDNM